MIPVLFLQTVKLSKESLSGTKPQLMEDEGFATLKCLHLGEEWSTWRVFSLDFSPLCASILSRGGDRDVER